ncbi:MAG TPA: hypothetical protein DEQ47_11955 [Solibacterales bacterium]|nr:hypothetical protein [Bryobacterales bacterium]
MRLTLVLAAATLLAGCTPKPKAELAPLLEEFIYTTLSFSPSAATGQGYHVHHGRKLDDELDDFSFPALQRQMKFYADFHKRLEQIDRTRLSSEDRADLDIIEGQIALALFDLGLIHSPQHNPTVYVEALGNALFNPYVLEYAPPAERFRSIIARLRQVPHYVDVAHGSLRAVPPAWMDVAVEENDGNIALIDGALRGAAPAELKTEYDEAAAPALDALRAFNRFLKSELPKRQIGHLPSWRLGAEHYRMKFRFALGTDRTPEDVLRQARADLETVRVRMRGIAMPLHAQWYPTHGETDAETVIREVLQRISDKRSTPASYLEDARHDLEEARQFVTAKNLLTLPSNANLKVIPTPEFVRGVYSVGGFNPAPPLEPRLGAFYWVTPIPPDWPAARVESKLREYNFYKLKLLTMHEAVPGHYVQGEFANAVQPSSRRVLRAVYGNTPYVEGWAEYATQMMLDEGLLDHSPELRLTFLKEELRVIANAIIDIRLQMDQMSEAEVAPFLESKTFQEHEEATQKLRRAQLTSAQLPAYLVGWRDWMRVRGEYRARKGAGYRLHDFNDAALREGAVPLPVLGRLLAGQ